MIDCKSFCLSHTVIKALAESPCLSTSSSLTLAHSHELTYCLFLCKGMPEEAVKTWKSLNLNVINFCSSTSNDTTVMHLYALLSIGCLRPTATRLRFSRLQRASFAIVVIAVCSKTEVPVEKCSNNSNIIENNQPPIIRSALDSVHKKRNDSNNCSCWILYNFSYRWFARMVGISRYQNNQRYRLCYNN